MAGRTPMGYDVINKKLIVNESEAETVRHIFKRYLELGSVKMLQTDLEQSGVRSKPHIAKDGTAYGACIMYRGALSHLLTNQIYRGVIAFKGDLHEGEHERIVTEELFQSVQALLTAQGPGAVAKKKIASPAILKGILFDENGNRLQPTHSAKHGRKYRYYVSAPMVRDAKANPEGSRIPAADLERIVIQTVAARLRDRKWLSSISNLQANVSGFGKLADSASILAIEVDQQATRNSGILNKFVNRIDVSKKIIKLTVDAAALINLLVPAESGSDPLEPMERQHCVELIIAGQFLRCGKEVRLVIGNDDKAKIDKRLLREVVQSRKWFEDLSSGRISSIAELARKSGCNAAHVSRRISLAFLAPHVTNLIVSGTQPLSLTPERLKQACPLPVSWDDQRALLLD